MNTAEDACQRQLQAIAACNASWHVYTSVDAEGALAAARDSDARQAAGQKRGALDGVTIGIKDNIDVAGLPTTAGIGAFRDTIASTDAAVVKRLRAAGAVILGKLNMHEGALGATTDNPFFGCCSNPLAPDHTPGGSSGGSAAAVAGGLADTALGTDTMGSVRIPAAYCGVWGLKPTTGLIGGSGLVPLSWTLDTIGPIARDANTIADLLEVMAGPDADDPYSARPPAGWTAKAPACDLKNVVLGRPTAIDTVACEPAVLQAFADLERRLRDLGVTITPIEIPGWDPSVVRRAGLLISEAEAGSLMGARIDADPAGFSETFRAMIAYGRSAPAERLARAYHRLDRLRLNTGQAMATVDALILPTTPHRAFLHGQPAPASQADFTAFANATRLPAIAFPLACADGGLPASAQLVGRSFEEARLIAIASAIDRCLE